MIHANCWMTCLPKSQVWHVEALIDSIGCSDIGVLCLYSLSHNSLTTAVWGDLKLTHEARVTCQSTGSDEQGLTSLGDRSMEFNECIMITASLSAWKCGEEHATLRTQISLGSFYLCFHCSYFPSPALTGPETHRSFGKALFPDLQAEMKAVRAHVQYVRTRSNKSISLPQLTAPHESAKWESSYFLWEIACAQKSVYRKVNSLAFGIKPLAEMMEEAWSCNKHVCFYASALRAGAECKTFTSTFEESFLFIYFHLFCSIETIRESLRKSGVGKQQFLLLSVNFRGGGDMSVHRTRNFLAQIVLQGCSSGERLSLGTFEWQQRRLNDFFLQQSSGPRGFSAHCETRIGSHCMLSAFYLNVQ